MIIGVIVACEIGFWVLIALGLAARYILKRRRLGTVLLALTPVVDLVLLIAVGIDLRAGGTPTFAHALAAVYLGVSIAYGHRMIRWADVRFAHRFAGGPAPVPLYGWAYAKGCWVGLLHTIAATAIAAGTLWLLTVLAQPGVDLSGLTSAYRILGIILLADTIWALGYTIWPKREPAPAAS